MKIVVNYDKPISKKCLKMVITKDIQRMENEILEDLEEAKEFEFITALNGFYYTVKFSAIYDYGEIIVQVFSLKQNEVKRNFYTVPERKYI